MNEAAAVRERALSWSVEGADTLGIVHEPAAGAGACGVLVLVGGPQYRAGSHRQFVELARHLAARGYPVLRFDYRGMGDSHGIFRDFEHVAVDLDAAIECFCRECPDLRELVIWGLCDAASAACFHAHLHRRVTGLVLVNPWVRTAQGQARAYLRHYYLQRLLSPELWKKVLSGGFRIGDSLRGLGQNLARARAAEPVEPAAAPVVPPAGAERAEGSRDPTPLPQRMLEGLQKFRGDVLLALSGNDLTAAEFLDQVKASRGWRRRLAARGVTRRDYPLANHTFSSAEWKQALARDTVDWLDRRRRV